jgi:hypothetical protein
LGGWVSVGRWEAGEGWGCGDDGGMATEAMEAENGRGLARWIGEGVVELRGQAGGFVGLSERMTPSRALRTRIPVELVLKHLAQNGEYSRTKGATWNLARAINSQGP